MAIAAFTFTSCEDVPEPFGQPINPNKEEIVIEPTGSGTEADPYNVAKVTEVIKAMADGDVKSDVYTKGFICQIDEIDTEGTYGNSTYWISDDAEGKSGKYEVYHGFGLGGQKFNEASATLIKVGDAVIIKGNIKNYKGTTPEYDGGSMIVELNGQKAGGGGGGDTPSGDVKTVSVSDFLAAKVNTSDWYQLTGTIKNLKDGDKYGNFDIEDATGSVYVYGLLAEKGGEKGKFQDLVAAKGIANGKKITIIGNRGEYNSSAQVANAYFVKIEDGEGGGGGDTPSGDGDGTEAKPYGVAAAIAAGSGSNVFVKAYIVGWIEGQTLSSGAHFDANATVASNILIADSPDETNVDKCMPVQLPSGAVRTAVNLQNNAGNYKKEIILVGNIEKYFGAPGIKGTSYAKIGDTEAGTKPSGGEGEGGGGGDTPSGDAQVVTIAQFNAAAVSTDVWYQLTGTIKNLKDGDKYGNFDIEDATGSVYVYGLLSEKGGAKQKFQDLVTAKGIANGKKITIIGNRGAYNDKIEVVNAYFVSIE
jgi:RPA family protein